MSRSLNTTTPQAAHNSSNDTDTRGNLNTQIQPAEGNNQNNSGRSRTYVIVITIPYTSRTYRYCQEIGRGNFFSLDTKGERKHAKDYHRNAELIFSCAKCSKNYKTLRGADCHAPNCNGPKPALINSQQYGATYAIKSGLSQHDRHRHAEDRNKARIQAEIKPSLLERKKTSGQTFATEDVELVILIELNNPGITNITPIMQPYLPDKSTR